MNIMNGGVSAPKGFSSGGVHCGIRKNRSKLDLGLIYSQVPCTTAAVYTTNKVKAAPIFVTKENIANGISQAVIVNSGNANACAPNGLENAKKMCRLAADALGISEKDVVVASTGVIGVELDVSPIENGMKALVDDLNANSSENAANAIMTTDLSQKTIAIEIEIGGSLVKIGAIAKGSGMIAPNMGTMLSFITTDVNISAEMLQKAISCSTELSYNMVSVDGDTSTNDMAVVLANGLAENLKITELDDNFNKFFEALNFVNQTLAKEIARDGEGATKLITCKVSGAKTYEDAKALSKSVISSSLVKAAMFGSDANWGRVLCAMGYSSGSFSPETAVVSFASKNGTIKVCEKGAGLVFDEDLAKKILNTDAVEILVELSDGTCSAEAWGCDLTYDYVKINGDYRT